jgi:hypothetical protein
MMGSLEVIGRQVNHASPERLCELYDQVGMEMVWCPSGDLHTIHTSLPVRLISDGDDRTCQATVRSMNLPRLSKAA